MSHSRSERRHRRKRLFLKIWKKSRNTGWGDFDPDWQKLDAIVRVTTGCLCSCSMCGNPRKHYGNSARAKSRQETRLANWKQDIYD